MTDEEKKAIEMLDKFTTEHKLYNIKQSDNLEGNIEIILNLIQKQEKVIDEIAKEINDEYFEDIKQNFYRKVEEDE